MTNSANALQAAATYQFYSPAEYRAAVRTQIQAAEVGDRVLMMSMTFDPSEPEISGITDDLTAAAARGASVKLGVDAYAFLTSTQGLGPLFYHGSLPVDLGEPYRSRKAVLDSINSYASGQAVILNQPDRRYSLPIAGRSHIKIAIVRNTVWLGGCNLDNPRWLDMMIGFEDAGAADWAYRTMSDVLDDGSVSRALDRQDLRYQIDENTEIILDCGIRSQSAIFSEALSVIDRAGDKLVMTGQYFPNSITARHLLQADRRGVEQEIVFTHPKAHRPHGGRIAELGQRYSLLREQLRLPRRLFQYALTADDPFLHAKFLSNGNQFLIGSHNYVRAGVMLGTAEIALSSKDPELAHRGVGQLHTMLSGTSHRHTATEA